LNKKVSLLYISNTYLFFIYQHSFLKHVSRSGDLERMIKEFQLIEEQGVKEMDGKGEDEEDKFILVITNEQSNQRFLLSEEKSSLLHLGKQKDAGEDSIRLEKKSLSFIIINDRSSLSYYLK
jgi:hypothetical protein